MTRRATDTTLLLCLATALITLSHLDNFVPDPRIAAGGAVGNALFFFLSGYGLTLSLNASGPGGAAPPLRDYLARRVLRLYPAALLVALVMIAIGLVRIEGPLDLLTAFVWPTPFWFVSAVMAFYLPVYFIARLRPAGIATAMLLLLIPYAFFYRQLELSTFVVEGKDHFKWINYFGITLFGGLVARLGWQPRFGAAALAALLGSLLAFLAAKLTLFRFGLGEWQFVFHLLLYPIVLASYHVFASPSVLRPLRATPVFPAVALLGGLTLELYLTQTAWIRWLEKQPLPDSHTLRLLLALLPLPVFALLARGLAQRAVTAGARLWRALRPPRVAGTQRTGDLT